MGSRGDGEQEQALVLTILHLRANPFLLSFRGDCHSLEGDLDLWRLLSIVTKSGSAWKIILSPVLEQNCTPMKLSPEW